MPSLVGRELSLERGQAVVPEGVEVRAQLVDTFVTCPIQSLCPLAPQVQQPNRFEHAEVLRDGLSRGLEVLGYLARRELAIVHQPKNRHSPRLSESLEQVLQSLRSLATDNCRV
jgi:hypothetical protein